MAKIQSPLLGYNNNVRHKNRVFHIQTEDSGVKHPHVITHLFMDGGRILKSVKRSYAEHVGADNLSDTVRTMMKEQHKAMFIALRDGEYDNLLEPPNAGRPSPEAPRPAPEASRAEPPTPRIEPPAPVALGAAPGVVAAAPRELVPEPPPSVRVHEPPPSVRAHELPPPSRNLFRKELPVSGSYRQVDGESSKSSPPSQRGRSFPEEVRTSPSAFAPPQALASAPAPAPPRPALPPDRERRYAPARPAAIFGSPRALKNASIFVEDALNDRSLNEVILSYLLADLSPPEK